MSLSAQNAGFTLIELMIVIVLVAIFITVGVPSFQNLVSDNRLSTQANSFVASIQLARSEALKLRTPVSVCRSTNGTACAAAGAWESGWLVFVDTNSNGSIEGERIIKAQGSLSSGNTLRATAAPFTSFINYQPSGLQSTTNTATYKICNGNNPDITKARQISVSRTGHVRTTTGVAVCP